MLCAMRFWLVWSSCLLDSMGDADYRVFHAFVPIRGNLGVETYLGNGPGSNGIVMRLDDHPNWRRISFTCISRWASCAMRKTRGDLARAYMHADPGHFLKNTLKRIYFFWAGVPSDAAPVIEFFRLLNYGFISVAGLLGLMLALRNHVPAAGFNGVDLCAAASALLHRLRAGPVSSSF